ncbi:MAG: TolB family protein [Planctomycetota bacterium]
MMIYEGRGMWMGLLALVILWTCNLALGNYHEDPYYLEEQRWAQIFTGLLAATVVYLVWKSLLDKPAQRLIDEETGELHLHQEKHSLFLIPVRWLPLVLIAGGFLWPVLDDLDEPDHDEWKGYQMVRAMTLPVEETATLFAPGIVCDPMDQRDTAISEDGMHFLYTLQIQGTARIIHMQKSGSGWAEAKVPSFSGIVGGTYRDLEPAFHPGTHTLYFASDRPLPGEEEAGDFNLWRVEFLDGAWTQPEPLDALNEEGNEFYPSLTNDGTLYFTARREGGVGGEDLWMAKPNGRSFYPPILMPGAINTETDEFNGAVHPDGTLFAFGSARPDGVGGGDLYFSRLLEDGTWSAGVLGGEAFNTTKLDFCPFFQPGTDVLWFTSTRGDLDRDILRSDSLSGMQKRWRNQGFGGQDLYNIRYDRNALFAAKPAPDPPSR